MSSLIEKQKIRNIMKEAETKIGEEDFKECMQLTAKAFAISKRILVSEESGRLKRYTFFNVLNELDESRITFSYSLNDNFRSLKTSMENMIRETMEKIVTEINNKIIGKTNDFVKDFVRELSEEIKVLQLGIHMRKYHKFKKVSPHTFFTIGSVEPRIIDTKEDNYS